VTVGGWRCKGVWNTGAGAIVSLCLVQSFPAHECGFVDASRRGASRRSLVSVVALLCGLVLSSHAIAQASAYAAAFVSQVVPSSIQLFTATTVSVTMQNTGTATWVKSQGDVFLATQEPQDNYYWCIQDNRYGSRSGNRVLLPNDVAPNDQVTFTFAVKPLSCGFTGPSPLRFRMLSETHGTFGEETPDPKTNVTNAAQYVSQQVPAAVPAGGTINVDVTYQNTTMDTWSPDAGYALVPAAGTANTWGITTVPLPVAVAPGDSVTFSFYIVAPSTIGTYNFQWQMSAPGGVAFGQVSPATSVQVVAAGSANYEGLWWNSPAGSESGWGINIAHQGIVIYMTWFTYDLTGKALWLAMTAQQDTTGAFVGTLSRFTGPPFSAVPFNPGQVRGTSVGTGTLSFTDINNGTFLYTMNGVAQTKSITRQTFGQPPTCTFGIEDPSLAYNYQDLWWASPAGVEAGWGVNLTHQGDIIFATWFTYDVDGTGPAFNAVPFDPSDVIATSVGTATFTFTDGNTGTFDYTVNTVSQSKAITREIFQAPGTVCQ
jgi:hypothetical protein